MDTLNLKPLTDDWQEVDASRVPDGLDWHASPESRGWIVVHSYAADFDAGVVYMKQYDRSDRTTGYSARLMAEGEAESFEPWNRTPR
jgi:hypothetical protein